MNKKAITAFACAVALGALSKASVAVDIGLYDWGFNFDGTSYCEVGPCSNDSVDPLTIPGLSSGAFDFATGLGTLTATLNGAGSHSFVAFFDHEIDESINTFVNETGSAVNVGDLGAGQKWEIDQPGNNAGGNIGSGGVPYYGDIFGNFLDDLLDEMVFYDWFDNQSLISPPAFDDVSTALSFAFDLLPGERGVVSLTVTETEPTSGFYLIHHDPDSPASIYLSGDLKVIPVAVPVPATLALMGAGLIGFGGILRRRRQRSA